MGIVKRTTVKDAYFTRDYYAAQSLQARKLKELRKAKKRRPMEERAKAITEAVVKVLSD